MLRRIGIALGVAVVGLLAFIVSRPAAFRVERAAQLGAPPGVVFGLINDLHRWALWSPWEKMDPSSQKTFSGSPAGAGAIYDWAGNDKVGEGRMTILSATPKERVQLKLEFLKPFQATNDVQFLLKPTEGGTQVRWVMTGENGFLGKAISVFMDMDKMVGKDFEAGLAELRRVAEAEAKVVASPAQVSPAVPEGP